MTPDVRTLSISPYGIPRAELLACWYWKDKNKGKTVPEQVFLIQNKLKHPHATQIGLHEGENQPPQYSNKNTIDTLCLRIGNNVITRPGE